MKRLALIFLLAGAGGYWLHAMVPIALFGASAFFGLIDSISRSGVKRRMLAPLVLVATFCAISAAVSISAGAEMETTLRVLLTPIVVVSAVAAIRLNQSQLIFLVGIAGISSLVAGTLMYFQTGPMQLQLSASRLLSINRADGYWLVDSYFQGAPSIGAPLGLGAVILLSLALSAHGVRRWPVALAGALGTSLLLFTLSRAATIGLLIALIVGAFIWQFRSKVSAKSLPTTIFVFLLVGFAGASAYDLALEHIPGAEVRYRVLTKGIGQDRSMQERFDVWAEAVSLAASNPMGLGFSYARQGYLFSGYSAHNEYIGTLVSTGVLGFVVLLVVAISALVRSLKGFLKATSSDGKRLSLACIMVLLFSGILGLTEHFSVSSTRFMYPMLWMFIGIALSLGGPRRESN